MQLCYRSDLNMFVLTLVQDHSEITRFTQLLNIQFLMQNAQTSQDYYDLWVCKTSEDQKNEGCSILACVLDNRIPINLARHELSLSYSDNLVQQYQPSPNTRCLCSLFMLARHFKNEFLTSHPKSQVYLESEKCRSRRIYTFIQFIYEL